MAQNSSNLKIYNTLSRTVERFVPRVPGQVGMYVCGMTVYDQCHIGHARSALAFDVVARYLRYSGYTVNYVRNHTDVDDKIIARALRDGKSGLEISARYIDELDQDLAALGIERPTVEPRVSRAIPEILEVIQRLVDRGHAYQGPSGDVYYGVETFAGYGKLSGRKLEDLRAGERVAIDQDKHHPGDFVLWKSVAGPARLDGAEPCWDSPWGVGRPGWHIECSGMALQHLGEQFDIHGGGIDLVFPHHENEIAQSEGAIGASPFARYWMHNGHLTMPDASGEEIKMSKSLGNIVRIRDLVSEIPAEVLRLAYLETHYRSPLPWNPEQVPSSVAAMDRLYQAKEIMEQVLATGPEAPLEASGDPGQEVYALALAWPARFRAAMDEDFNTAAVIGSLFSLVRAINRLSNDKKKLRQSRKAMEPVVQVFEICAQVLGIGGSKPEAFFEELRQKRMRVQGRSVAEIDALLAARTAARAAKDWAQADAIRVSLDAQGIIVMDGPEGSTWRVRVTE